MIFAIEDLVETIGAKFFCCSPMDVCFDCLGSVVTHDLLGGLEDGGGAEELVNGGLRVFEEIVEIDGVVLCRV